MADEKVGQAYLQFLLDPALQAVSEKMQATPGKPETATERRAAAFMMLSPILVMTLHQQLLGGSDVSPVDGDAFLGLMQGWLASGLSQ